MKTFRNNQAARLALLITTGVLAISAAAFTQRNRTHADVRPASLNLEVDQAPVNRDTQERTSYASVVKEVSPAVVNILTASRVRNTSSGAPEMEDWMRRFFGPNMGPGPRRGLNMPPQRGIGSGVIVTKDGYILTNNHVIENADEVRVVMQDGREQTAKVVGRDPKSDVAVIKIEGRDDLPVIRMADSDNVEVGDVVLAVGNPFGIGQTVTKGIVSAKGRGNVGLDYEDFIQTDAAINPGNSGGALVDVEGRLVGINTAILSRSGGNQGIGIAIPTNLARDVMESLVTEGVVTRGFMGVMIQDLTPGLAEQFQIDESTKGALVGDVTPRSPAEKAGLQTGDVVVEYNGKKIRDSRHLKLEVARTKPGQTIPLKVVRDGRTRDLSVTVRQLPGSEVAGQPGSAANEDGTLDGVTVADLDSAARRELNLPANLKGVVVTEVDPASPSAEAGLRPGDVILEIDRKPVSSAEEAVELSAQVTKEKTLLRVWRDGGTRFVVVDESKAG